MLRSSNLLRNLRISGALGVEIYYRDANAMLDRTFAQIVQIWLPLPGLGEVFRHAFGEKNMPGIGAIHHSLGQINAGSGDIRSLINISHLVDRTTMNAHPQLNAWMPFQRLTNFECALNGTFRAVKKNQCHPVAHRQSN